MLIEVTKLVLWRWLPCGNAWDLGKGMGEETGEEGKVARVSKRVGQIAKLCNRASLT